MVSLKNSVCPARPWRKKNLEIGMKDQILGHSDEEKGQASLGTKREQGLRLITIRQERPELLAFSASGQEGAVNGWTATSEEKRWICPMELSIL